MHIDAMFALCVDYTLQHLNTANYCIGRFWKNTKTPNYRVAGSRKTTNTVSTSFVALQMITINIANYSTCLKERGHRKHLGPSTVITAFGALVRQQIR